MIEAYIQLHYEGCAHSVEVWDGDNLVGGIYGVIIGSIFSGESMFSRTRDSSKVAIAHLCSWMKKSKHAAPRLSDRKSASSLVGSNLAEA